MTQEIKGGQTGPDSLGGVQTSLPKPDVTPVTLPLVDYRLVSIPAETERRARLLSVVSVDSMGVAHCLDDRSATETSLVAVRVDDSKNAALVPFEVDQDQLRLHLPSDRPSRIGFFVGYASSQDVTAVLRMGLYPGVPLTTQAVSDERVAEVMYGLEGIKANETEELRWADQVGLYSNLGFDRSRSRGMFNKNHRPNPASDIWQESPLIILPDELFDMVRHFDPNDVKKDEFQVQLYGIKSIPALPKFPNALDYPFGTSGGGKTLSYGGELIGGLGIGFGEAVNRTAQTKGTDIDSLRGAFKIIVTPQ